MRMSVKKVESNDELNQAFAIRQKVFVQEQGVPEDQEIDEKESSSIHFLAKLDYKAIGTCRMRWYKPHVAKAERVAVLPEGRGTGAGRELMLALEEYARHQGAKKIVLSAQTHALPFYEKLGYIAEGDVYLDAGIDHKDMQKKLSL
ncbi:GNAT family N-acetyltransferase [Thermoactinomyces sp. DSM 45892]|uniref:GNAT family N-acetyltransferase n=1 Tax=Thermoactinomyces sp. DSM 45892 TaxID=1882753 RepID=UPI00089978E5|nr:GNAT family N-acetyltransferase [Thermoactinomyces sp. DSM 45892]SDY70656.1 Predicted N-acyltransferase, GNAT family [Thermoactinomyces sp. DSM 45892]